MASPRFILTRASVDDIPEITRLEYKCFHQPFVRELFMGCKSEADIPLMAAKHIRDMAADPYEVWVKIVDKTTGKIVAASNWKFFVNGGAPHSSDEYPPDWLEADLRKKAYSIMSTINAARRKANPGAHVHGHIGFTDPDYRRQGLLSMVMQWGCGIADQLCLPAWIEPTEDGASLYRKFGFYDVEPMEGLSGNFMKRDARVGGIERGPVVPQSMIPGGGRYHSKL